MAIRINIPPATRLFLVCLISLSLLYNIARWRQISSVGGTPSTEPSVPYLTLVPSSFIIYPWTLLTATFVEQNIFTLFLNGATIFYGGKYLERAWGSREFSKFILTISLIPNIVIIPIYILWGVIMGNTTRACVISSLRIVLCPLLTVSQSNPNLRRNFHSSILPRCLQATSPRAHSHRFQGPRQNAR